MVGILAVVGVEFFLGSAGKEQQTQAEADRAFKRSLTDLHQSQAKPGERCRGVQLDRPAEGVCRASEVQLSQRGVAQDALSVRQLRG